VYREPDINDVKEKAASLGATLSDAEAEVYLRFVKAKLPEVDAFVQDPDGAAVPPRFPGRRDRGYRPTSEEDPHRAWMWKCSIPGASDGLLSGKRISFKDHIAVAGIPESFGAFAFDAFVPDYDATVVSRSLEAGGTVVGKNLMDGLAGGFAFSGGVGDYARALNPHDYQRVTGGSSSGSAAALVLGEVDVSFGGDQGGSIRIPASWSGCVGLKPTFGLLSHFGIGFGSDQSIDYTGPMTMSVEDAARALDATAGLDGLDPRQTAAVPATYDSLSHLHDGVKGLRIGVLKEGFDGATDEVSMSVRAAVDVLAGLGAKVSWVSVPEHLKVATPQGVLGMEGGLAIRQAGFMGAWARTYYPESTIEAVMRATRDREFSINPRVLGNEIMALYNKQFYSGRAYARAQNIRPKFIAAYDRVFAAVDVIVMPTTPTQAWKHEDVTDKVAALEHALFELFGSAPRNTRPFNFTGHPAISVPTEKMNNLPVGLQIVAPVFRDDLTLRVAQAYASAVPFADHLKVGS